MEVKNGKYTKTWKVYQYQFEIAKVEGKRKYISKTVYCKKKMIREDGFNGAEIKDVADILGHSRIEITENYYILSSWKTRKEANDMLEKIIDSSVTFTLF